MNLPRKKKNAENNGPKQPDLNNIIGLRAEVLDQPITETLEQNYMPYAMSVILSRAIPEIDGFKPSHRKLLYTMYKAGLLTGARTKSANIVGRTMQLNPHGDSAIYATMVRLARGNEALLTPFVDSKGNFGKVYSRDMAFAASRYTEAKLDPICAELFRDIDKDTVDMVPNYDGSMLEPRLLPTTYPNILVSANQGIAVGMASMICGFNLSEVCKTTIEWIRDPECDLLATLPAPDFSTGGEIIYDKEAMRQIYETGQGSFKIRSRWRHLPKENIIEVYEIPYTTTVEAILDKCAELMKAGKLKEVSDIRDETDLSGLKIAIDLKRGVNPEALMQRLFQQTPLMDSFACNFNVLVGDMPRVLGVREIIEEWTAWRIECIKRRIYFDIGKKKERLHLLQGLKKILLDIDRAIAIIRDTESEADVVPNLMIGFGIDEVQADFIAEIRLRNINKEYILKRIADVDLLQQEIADLEATLKSKSKIQKLIISDLESVDKKFGKPRKTGLISSEDAGNWTPQNEIADYPVHLFISREGYLKKITPLSLRMSGDQKYKENDSAYQYFETTNKAELLVFSSAFQCYKCHLFDFEDSKASVLGDYLPGKLNMDPGETVVFSVLPGEKYEGDLLFFFENGKCARVSLSSYLTTGNRRRLTGAYSDRSPLIAAFHLLTDEELICTSTDTRTLAFRSSLLTPKTSRSTIGVGVMALKKNQKLASVAKLSDYPLENLSRYRSRSLPAPGALLKAEDAGMKQLSF